MNVSFSVGRRSFDARRCATAGLVHWQGALHQAVETHQAALELASDLGGQPVPFTGMAYVGIAAGLYEWNDLDGAMRYATEGIELAERGGFSSYHLVGYARLAQIYQARGDVDGVWEIIRKAEWLAQQQDYAYLMTVIADLRARLWVAQGNLATASRWAQKHRLSPVDRLSLTREVEQIAVVRALITCASHRGPVRGDEIGEALSLLARLLQAAEAAGQIKSAIKILALQALAFQAQDNLDGALSALERALFLAEPEGYVRTFADEGEPMARLLSQILEAQRKGRRALSRGIAPNYVARLLAAFGQEVELTSFAMESLIEPLTERELEVLRLVVAGLSNPEIAEELVIAVSTVNLFLVVVLVSLAGCIVGKSNLSTPPTTPVSTSEPLPLLTTTMPTEKAKSGITIMGAENISRFKDVAADGDVARAPWSLPPPMNDFAITEGTFFYNPQIHPSVVLLGRILRYNTFRVVIAVCHRFERLPGSRRAGS